MRHNVERLAPPPMPLPNLLFLLRAPIHPSCRIADVAKERIALVAHNLELRVRGVYANTVRGDGGRGGSVLNGRLRALEELEDYTRQLTGDEMKGVERKHTSWRTSDRLFPSVSFASFILSRTPTSCPSTYSSAVTMPSLMALQICFLMRPVASGRRVL